MGLHKEGALIHLLLTEADAEDRRIKSLAARKITIFSRVHKGQFPRAVLFDESAFNGTKKLQGLWPTDVEDADLVRHIADDAAALRIEVEPQCGGPLSEPESVVCCVIARPDEVPVRPCIVQSACGELCAQPAARCDAAVMK